MKLAVMLLFWSLALAQQSSTTSAPCSPIAPNNTGTITINCPDATSRDAVLALLKQNQGNVKITLGKLDECNQGIRDIKQQQASRFDEQAHRLSEIMKAVAGADLSPKKLLAKYPLGYVIFDLDYRNDVFPYQSKTLLAQYKLDWTNVGIVKPECPFPGAVSCKPDMIALRMPDFSLDGYVFKTFSVGGPKQVGPLPENVIYDLEMDPEILAIRKDGIVFLIGFRRSSLAH